MTIIIAKAYGFDALDGCEFDIVYDTDARWIYANGQQIPGTWGCDTIEKAISTVRDIWGDWATYTEVYPA